MRKIIERIEALGPVAVLGSGGAVIALFLVALIGALSIDDSGDKGPSEVATSDTTDTTASLGGTDTTAVVDPNAPSTSLAPGATVPGGAPATTVKGSTATTVKGSATTVKGVTTTVPAVGATRTGVTDTAFKWGLHAPETFDGAPLNLAEDPLLGVQIYMDAINAAGGINGRKIDKKFRDDRYTVTGGRDAANGLINDEKVFFVSGTLGVDQVAQVATEAKKRGVTYMAAGGPESKFGELNMFQISASYDSVLIKLADFLGTETKKPAGTGAGQSIYGGKTKIGVTSLNTPYILPSVENQFKNQLAKHGLSLVRIVKIEKPTEQTSYASQCQDLVDSGAQIIVPTQDPISTSRMVTTGQCQNANFSAAKPDGWRWTMANFANDGDVALTLMAGQWTGIRGLGGGCYYLNSNPAGPEITAECGALNKARKIWEASRGADSFKKDGQGGVAGYQVVNFWVKAVKDAGADLTRERFRAALLNYQGYADLVSAPLTFKGAANIAHGSDSFVVYEGDSKGTPVFADDTWKQISNGLSSNF